MKISLTFALFAASVALSWGARAQSTGITVEHAWSRATPGGTSTGVVYLTITDTGTPDQWVASQTPVAAAAELHESKTANGMSSMTAVDSLPVAPGHPITLAPGGYHLMLTGLKHPLKAGDQFPLTLRFLHAEPVTITVAVQPLGAAAPVDDMSGMSHMMQ